MKNIVLIGISGSGKTVIGRQLAETLQREFIDLDSLISEREGLAIAEIFEKGGEEGFRQAETRAINALAERGSAVIACGGGAVLKEENMSMLSQKGIVVFLNRSVENILGKVNLKDRPLLSRQPWRLHEIYRERLPLYEKYADFRVSLEHREEVLKKLLHITALQQKGKRLAVIGDPVDHSLSPQIHRAALSPLIKELSYEKVRLERSGLAGWMAGPAGTEYDGFNVTMPHKEAIIPFLHRVEEEADMMGAVNTVVNRGGELHGFSTDGGGFAAALRSIGRSFKGKEVAIMGSGGAAAAIAMKAAREGASKIHIVARKREKRMAILHKIEAAYGGGRGIGHEGLDSIPAKAAGNPWDSQIIINATPLGMKGNGEDFTDFGFLDQVGRDAVICDIVYDPEKTRLMKEAENRNIKTLGGIHMLIEQALISDCLYLEAEIGREKAFNRVAAGLQWRFKEI
ncbi:hypothetical protein MASR2M70_05450 [Bacillota bacterium]